MRLPVAAKIALTTAGTVPNQAAVTPDSNSPSSLEAPMNTDSTASTRPRSASGVASGTMAPRTKTLTLSAAPRTRRAAKESQKFRDTPKETAARPKMPTAKNKRRPTWRFSGHWVRKTAMATAPIPGPLRKMPRPSGPTCRMSLAKTGSRAAAPLNNTAKRSREMAPRRILWRKMRATPASNDLRVASSPRLAGGACIMKTANAAASRPSVVAL